jgi:Glycosyltransferase family 87
MTTAVAPWLGRAMLPGSTTNRALRWMLAGLAVVVIAATLVHYYLFIYPFGVDLEIPLRAGERWAAGGQPYLASAFTSGPGATQPFLYPPFVLPLLAALAPLPRGPLELGWSVVCLLSAIAALRRLEVPPLLWLPVLCWPPFFEPIVGGNVQIILFLAFTILFWRPSGRSLEPRPRDPTDPRESGAAMGFLAVSIGALKVSQAHPWLFLLRHRWRAAGGGAAVVVAIALAGTLVTGLQPWRDWISQVRLATDPTWDLGGIALSRFVPPPIGLVVTIASVAALWIVPRRDPGPWVGLLSVLGAVSLHTFGLLFLVPAMLLIRRELALIAAIFVATFSYLGMWAGIVVVFVGLLAGTRWPAVHEHPEVDSGGTVLVAT